MFKKKPKTDIELHKPDRLDPRASGDSNSSEMGGELQQFLSLSRRPTTVVQFLAIGRLGMKCSHQRNRRHVREWLLALGIVDNTVH